MTTTGSGTAPVGAARLRRGAPTVVVLLLAVVIGVAAWQWDNVTQLAGFPLRSNISGVAPPVGDIPGWRQTFVDDFNGDSLSDRWGVYDGTPSGDPNSEWDSSHVDVRESQLILEGSEENGRWITGGVSNHTVAQTYGKWDVRFRIDASDEITVAFLLWPQGGQWPPEIDFMEDDGGLRQQASGFVHFVDGSGRGKIQRNVMADFTEWQTIGLEWGPGVVTYTLNGQPWGTVTGEVVPAQPMWLAMQTQSGGCARKAAYSENLCPIAGTPDIANVYIDWVAIYAPN